METPTEIYFYGINDEYAYMSNFYKIDFVDNISNIRYNCSEQYFMYKKCELFDKTNVSLLNLILNETSPTKIKSYGRRVKNFNDDVWATHKYNIMINGLMLKFIQNETIKQKLINTGNKTLYEASKFDKIWGIGYYAIDAVNTPKHKFGQNLLGNALMHVRTELIYGL
jgi:ribA/ribD-fused uncharacterized protein